MGTLLRTGRAILILFIPLPALGRQNPFACPGPFLLNLNTSDFVILFLLYFFLMLQFLVNFLLLLNPLSHPGCGHCGVASPYISGATPNLRGRSQ
jgi:hypothetical protein